MYREEVIALERKYWQLQLPLYEKVGILLDNHPILIQKFFAA